MNLKNQVHIIGMQFYTLEDFRLLLRDHPKIELSQEAKDNIIAGSQFVLSKAEEDIYIYGVNTGYGSLCETRVGQENLELLQYKHVISHACGVGEPAPEDVARLTFFIKLLTFRSGCTGISLDVVERMIDFWNKDIIPVIPKKGTVGASGDLAPLAHMALPLLGLGEVHYKGKIVPSAEVLLQQKWSPIKLKPKEGLALTNGVQYINAWAIKSLLSIEEFVKGADLIAALSIQGFSCSKTFYQKLYLDTSFHEERWLVGENLRKILADSNHFDLDTCNKSKQDPYSFRCIPQVHGAVRQTFYHAKTVMEKECNGVSDNPLFFPKENQILFGGALHGESTAFVLDFLAIALSELANISERRSYQLLSGCRGLPSFLIDHPGLNSGFMVVQYTAAALVNENKVLSTPASIDTIPTCQLQEDSVSMGGTSAYKLNQIIENTRIVLAIELLIAAQAIDQNISLQLSPLTKKVHSELRELVPTLKEDRIMSPDIQKAESYLTEKLTKWRTELI